MGEKSVHCLPCVLRPPHLLLVLGGVVKLGSGYRVDHILSFSSDKARIIDDRHSPCRPARRTRSLCLNVYHIQFMYGCRQTM